MSDQPVLAGIRAGDVQGSRHAHQAAFLRLYLFPFVGVVAGWSAGMDLLLVSSLAVAVVSGWLATYSL